MNAAAYTAVDKAESERELSQQVNAVAPGVLAEEAHRLGALMVHYSTDYVFDGEKRSPYTEDDAPNPISHYARTKREGERRHRRKRLPAPGPAHELGLRSPCRELLSGHRAQGRGRRADAHGR